MKKLFTLIAAVLTSFSLMADGTALSSLSFSGITALPSAYTYSSSNTPSYQSSQGPSGDKRSCILVGNGGKGQTPTIKSDGPVTSEGKRWMAFCPAEDCDLEIVCTGNSKVFKLFDKDHYVAKADVDTLSTVLSSYTGTSSWATWSINGLKAGTWYVLSASSSSSYVASMQFTSTETPECPDSLYISGETEYVEGEKISLTANLKAGNGNITYQWYKGGTAEENKLAGKTSYKLEIDPCEVSDGGDYYCIASKTDCSNQQNTEAYTIVVNEIPAAGTANISYALSGTTTTGTVIGVSSISSLSTSFTVNTLTMSGTKSGYSGGIKGTQEITEMDEDDYVDLQFTVADDYAFTPSAISVKVNPFNETGAVKAVVKMMDSKTEVASNILACSKNTDNEAQFADGAFTGKKFEGTIHLRMYFYGPASTKTFYIKSPITITGTVAAKTPTSLDNTTSEPNAIKRIENGMLIIEKNGVRYNAQGQVIR